MKAFWVIGDLGVITSNQQIKRDGIQEENFFSQQHNLPTKNDGLTHFISILILYVCILSDQIISRILVERNRMFPLFVQYLQKYELLFHVMLVSIMPWPSLLSLHICKKRKY